MAIQRTTPGSYQAPVEGIVDYGAFQEGFASSFILPQPEEEEEKPEPIQYDKQNATYVKIDDAPDDGMVFNQNVADQVNDNIARITKETNLRLNELAGGGKTNQQAINNEYKDYANFKQQVNDFNIFNSEVLDKEVLMDKILTKNIPFAKNSSGEAISILEFYSPKNQGENNSTTLSSFKDKNDRLILSLNSNGYSVNLSDLNKDTAKNFYVERSDLNSILKEFEATPEGKPKTIGPSDRNVTTTLSTYDLIGGNREQTQTKKTSKILDSVYADIETASRNYGKLLTSQKYDSQYASLYVAILFGKDNEENFNNQVSGGYIDAFKDSEGNITGKFVASNGIGYSFEQFKNEFFKKPTDPKDPDYIPSFVKDELVQQYGSDYHKINSGSGHHVDGGNGHAVKIDDIITKTTSTKDKAQGGSGLNLNFGGIGVDQALYNVVSETDKFGRSDDIAGTLFFTKDLPTGDNQSPRFDQEMLVSVNPSASGGKEKQVIFDLNKGSGRPKFIVYDFGYSMAEDAPKVYLDREGNPVEKGSRGAIEVIPKTAQEYVQSRFSSKADQKKYSKTINDVYDARKKNFAKKQDYMRNWRRDNPSPQKVGETEEDYKIRLKREEEAAYRIELQRQNQ